MTFYSYLAIVNLMDYAADPFCWSSRQAPAMLDLIEIVADNHRVKVLLLRYCAQLVSL